MLLTLKQAEDIADGALPFGREKAGLAVTAGFKSPKH